jgi:hypothetical protein
MEWVSYRPPKSALFGHRVRARNPRLGWKKINDLLERVADLALIGHVAPTLDCYLPHVSTARDVAEKRIAEAETLFGPPVSKILNNDHPHWRWELPPAALASAVGFVLDNDRFPEQANGPTRLHFAYNWLWREFAYLEDTRHKSNSMGIWIGKSVLGNTILVQPSFVFPAPWDSPELRAFLVEMEPHIPFRPSDGNFKRWLPPKSKGSSGRLLKLDKNWRKAWQTH